MTLEELREVCAKWFETHADDATLDTTGVERKTLLWVAKKLRTFPLPESAPVDDEFAGHTPEPWVAEANGVIRAGPLVQYSRGSARRQLASVMFLDFDSDEDSASMTKRRNADTRLMGAAVRLLRERDELSQAALGWSQHCDVLQMERNEAREERDAAIRERDEARAVAEEWATKDGNSPGYSAEKARTYGRIAAELKVERDEARDQVRQMVEKAVAQIARALEQRDEARAELTSWLEMHPSSSLLRAEVVGLNAALAASKRERDDATAEQLEAAKKVLESVVFEGRRCVVCLSAQHLGHAKWCSAGKVLAPQ